MRNLSDDDYPYTPIDIVNQSHHWKKNANIYLCSNVNLKGDIALIPVNISPGMCCKFIHSNETGTNRAEWRDVSFSVFCRWDFQMYAFSIGYVGKSYFTENVILCLLVLRDIKREPTQIFPFSTPWHCDYMVGGGHMSRPPPYTLLSFHPIEASGMLDSGPFHLLPQISFSHPFNLDGSFHSSVCPSPSQWHNEHQSAILFPSDFYLLRSPQLVESLLLPFSGGGWMASPFDLYLAIFLSHWIFLSTLLRCDKSNPQSRL